METSIHSPFERGREPDAPLHARLSCVKAKAGCPVLVNTSFNVRGEPIVHTPEDAFHCFMETELDAVAVGLYLVKCNQHTGLKRDYKGRMRARLMHAEK